MSAPRPSFRVRRLRRGDLIDFSPREDEEDLAETVREIERTQRGRGLDFVRVVDVPRGLELPVPKRRGRTA
jgi:tRNA(Ser,Leu) C12 N-acetylase TAN1